ncbi:MAG: aminotransferase class V-fold PLP-dependent enzyme [Phycisphaerae bacterium]|nr:aminotransferase class V-fold PLP-dependent enzyme [Gemmatimonadaceae bacterium]
MTTRRVFVKSAALFGAASLIPEQTAQAQGLVSGDPESSLEHPSTADPATLAQDEAHWKRVASNYRIPDNVTNMEAGYFGMMATPVLEAFHRHIDRANSASSYFARREFPAILQSVRERVATFVGAKTTEIALSRGATEALQALIGQYTRVGAGDTIMYADLDYNAMQWAMNALAARRGATVAKLNIPEPATREAILAAYTAALDQNPRTKLLLLTHCNNKTGLLLPVRDIVAIARPRGVDVVVDAAHSFGQIPLTVSQLDADFVGLNLHKWIGAPVGAGAMYIRSDKLDRIERAHADESAAPDRIESRLHTGTTNFAIVMTIPDALDFQATVGVENKAARLRYLRDRWVRAVRSTPGVNVLTTDDAALVGAISSFRLHGRGTAIANLAVTRTLLQDFGVFTFSRTGLAKGDCVRVTPTLYNSVADADKLARGINSIAAQG